MEQIKSYEQYSAVLADFKKDRSRCATNKLLMRQELTALIEAGKLYYEQDSDTLWFFSDEDYFYYAHLYAPANATIHMKKQDKDVVVELMGSPSRYDEQMDRALVAAGFERHDKYLEFGCQLETVLGAVEEKVAKLRKVWGEMGFTCRRAVKADYPALRKLWLEKLGLESYNVMALTEPELDEMERYGRCVVICDPEGNICSSCLYLKKGSVCYGYITATYRLGLGGWASSERYLCAYREGCTVDRSWAREDNYKSIHMVQGIKNPTGKFFWQFVYRVE